MDRHLLQFIREWTAVAIASAAPVVFCAFVSIPFALGHSPGDAGAATQSMPAAPRHMT